MRAGLSTIQQTLTPEAASVLNHSIAEASRRNHGQTTPLHVAATLLASPSGFLRQACIKSHPNSSHPLQCRALELCFSVALERLPTAQNMSPGMDPPISNALMAALKRAQAHQRRGCPEQQQQPLLAVKVELEQLIISILDDPSVSRVMREASFSSPAVKATIEQSLNTTCSVSNSSPIGLGFRSSTRNLYMNPRLQQSGGAQSGQQRSEEVKKVTDILVRCKKKNPVLVGESEPEMVVKELLTKIENKELDGVLKNVQIIRLDKEFTSDKAGIASKLKDLNALIEGKIAQEGVILDLGDLKWLVEQQVNPGVPNSGAIQQQQLVVAEVLAEMGKIVARFGSTGRLWLIGTATCETFLRCQVYHPSMENDWDLQVVPIAAKTPLSGMFTRFGSNGILSSSVESLSPLKGFQTTATASPRRVSENLDPAKRMSCCPQCSQNFEQELAKLSKEFEKSSSEVKAEVAKPPLPQWLHNAKTNDTDDKTVDQTQSKDQDLMWKQKSQDLQKKWNDTCLNLHPSFHKPGLGSERLVPLPIPMTGLINPSLLARQSFQPKLQLSRNLGDILQLNPNLVSNQPPERAVSPPSSPVRTDLVLGRPKVTESTAEKTHKVRIKDFLGCISSEPQNKLPELHSDKLFKTLDGADSYKRLLKGLMEKVWWQQEAASAVATTVTQCKLGNGKCRGAGSKGDIWLLFMGPDIIGKKKMASALSELVSGANPIMISLGSRRDNGEPEVRFRGKTVLDKIVDAVRRSPFSVIMLEDIDEADMVVRGNIKRAMERGRLADSHGREISLGNVTFILTANWLPDSLKFLSHGITLDEKKLTNLASGGWQLRLSLRGKTAKRRASWLQEEERPIKPRKETGSGLTFDLNKAADLGDDKDGSHNSSDLTVDHEEEHGFSNRLLMTPSTLPPSQELLNAVDSAIVFKPVDFGLIRRDVTSSIMKKFSTIIGAGIPIDILDEALEKIIGGVWLGRTGLEEWTEKVLVPSLHQLKSQLPTNPGATTDESLMVHLEPDDDSVSRSPGDMLPSSIRVVVDGL